MGIYANDVQKLYIAYFNRPADPVGLAYWEEQITKNGGSTAAVANAFSASAEYKSMYDGKSSAQIVDAIYQNLFGRSAEPSGLTYWAVRLENGTFNVGNIALSIMVGAQNDDKKVIDNKTVVATEFTTALDTTAEILAYSGTTAAEAARTFLKTVAATDASLTAAKAAVASTVSSIATVTPVNGQTFTLTSGVDTVTGTGNNDTFVADNTAGTGKYQTSVADTVTGGAGTDTLKIFSDGTNAVDALPQLSGVEKLVISGANYAAKTLDVSAISGLTDVTLTSPVVANADAAITLTVKNQGVTIANSTIAKASVAASKATTYNVGSTADTAATVTLDNVNSVTNGANTQKQIVDITGTAVTTLNIATANAASKLEIANTGAKIDTIKITGDKALNVTNALAAAIKTVDASGNTGGVTLNVSSFNAATLAVTGGSGKDSVTANAATIETIDLGAGDDTLTFAAVTNIASTDSYKGGDGADTLAFASAADANTVITGKLTGVFTGFDKLAVATVGADLDVSKFGVNSAVVTGDVTAAKTLSGFTSGATLSLTNNGTHTAQVAVGITGATDAGTPNDTLNLVMGADLTGNATYKVGVDGINILNVTATDTDAVTSTGVYTLTLGSASNLREVNVSGAAAVTLDSSGWGGTEGVKVVSTGSGDLTFTGTALSDVITGGSGKNNITGGNGKDTIDLSASAAKQDTVVLSGIKAAANADTIKGFVAGAAASTGDLVTLLAADTKDTTGAGAADFAGATAAATVVAANQAVAGFLTATKDVIEIGNAALGTNGDLSKATDGTELLKALATSGSATGITAETGAGGDTVYLVAYQNGNAYLFYANDAATAGLIDASEITLVGTFQGVTAGAFASGDFVLA